MESWVQLPPAHGCAFPRTMKVRGLVQSMVSTSDGHDWTYRGHEGSGQERPLTGGLGTGPDPHLQILHVPTFPRAMEGSRSHDGGQCMGGHRGEANQARGSEER